MNRREFIQALTAAGVVAAVGVDLIPRWSASAIRPALTFEEQYSIEWDCFIQRAVVRDNARVAACTAMGGIKPATEAERTAFLDVAAAQIAEFLNREGWA